MAANALRKPEPEALSARRPKRQPTPVQNHPSQQAKRKVKHFYDYSLLFAVMFISALGLVMIYSSSQYTAALRYDGNESYYFDKQVRFVLIGLVGAVVLSKFDYHLLRKLSRPIYWLAVGLLIATLVMGVASHGRTRWLRILGIQFQPTEPAKIALIVALSSMIAKCGHAVDQGKYLRRYFLASCLLAGLIGYANLSSGIIILGISCFMFFIGCRKTWPFALLGASGGAAVLCAKPLLSKWILANNITEVSGYRLQRLLAWAMPERFPDDAYQTLQGIYAIGSGGITGQGLGESIQKFGKLPEAQNDMIFSIVCEELGLIGALAIIFIFLFIIYRLMRIAINAPDLFGSMLCVGVMAHLSIQVILNISVVTNVIPNTGVTLPFISYGGSAVIFTLFEIGMALSVANRIKLE